MRGCISYSLYGDHPKYVLGMHENVTLAKGLYPGWVVRVHITKGHYAIAWLKRLGADVVEMPEAEATGSRGMFWRFLPLADGEFTHIAIRDADSRLNIRERMAVEAWINSGKSLHVMRDHPAHDGKHIMGGAWGCKTKSSEVAINIESQIRDWPHNNQYGDDEKLLGDRVWPAYYPQDFIRHRGDQTIGDDTAYPAHLPYSGYVCEPLVPPLDGNVRVVCLNAEHMPKRMKRFREQIKKSKILSRYPLDRWRGTAIEDRAVPDIWQQSARAHPHYFVATQDSKAFLCDTVTKKYDLLFAFEDDALISDNFDDALMAAWKELPLGWQALMLGGDWGQKHPHSENLRLALEMLGFYGILFSREGMSRLYGHSFQWNGETIDGCFKGLQMDNKKVYAVPEWVVTVNLEEQFGKGE